MTPAHWMAVAGWALFAAAIWLLVRAGCREGAILQGWDDCRRLLEQANAFRRPTWPSTGRS